MQYIITGPQFGLGKECEHVLRSLPDWFGIEEFIVKYVKEIHDHPTFTAKITDEVVGFVTIKQHFPTAAELYVLGVLPHYHRMGIGHDMLGNVEYYLRNQGTKFLQVKTLGPSNDDVSYQKTRHFYHSMGFSPLEEIKELWGHENPCLIMIKHL